MLGCVKLSGILMTNTAAATELDAFYPIRPECQADIPKTRFKIKVWEPLKSFDQLNFKMRRKILFGMLFVLVVEYSGIIFPINSLLQKIKYIKKGICFVFS